MTITKITDHAARAVAHLTERYRKPLVSALLSSLVAEIQELEEAFWDLRTKRSIETAEGAVLDLLGKLVGQPRENRDDDTYRLWIAARVLVNASTGTAPRLIAIADKVTSGAAIRFEDEPPAAFTLHVDEPIVGTDGVELAKLITQARAGGVGGQVHWFDVEDAFAFSDDPDDPELLSAAGFGAGRFSAVSDGRSMAFEPPPDAGGSGDEDSYLLTIL